jgi:LuxR family maltose regulon positive regulatory protein
MVNTLLATKLHIPRPRRELVHRPRLMAQLDAAVLGKLTLVSAPAGYGKTTLVADWIDRTQVQAGWVSLDEADNDVVRFLTYLVAALQQIDGDIGIDIQAALGEAQAPPTETLLNRLVNEIAVAAERKRRGENGDQQIVLVLDDYHVITDRAVHDTLSFLIDHSPPAVHLMIVGRADPPMHVPRLRVQGEVTEIRSSSCLILFIRVRLLGSPGTGDAFRTMSSIKLLIRCKPIPPSTRVSTGASKSNGFTLDGFRGTPQSASVM